MKKVLLGLALLLLLFIIGLFIILNKSQFTPNTPTAKIGAATFSLLIARQEPERQLGLSGRPNLPQDQGMIFLFDNPDYYSFWMRDMKFPIDIIYIRDGQIVTIFPNVMPPRSPQDTLPIYKPMAPADQVLEINAGLSRKYGFKPGDTVTIKNL